LRKGTQLFASSPNDYFYTGIRYVERNALRAGLIEGGEDRRSSSPWRRMDGNMEAKKLAHRWPLTEPSFSTARKRKPNSPPSATPSAAAAPSARPNGRRARRSGSV
jgi:hypothetical protein